MIVYLAGKITGDGSYRKKFADASLAARERWPDAVIFNPALLPEGASSTDYMAVCLPMLLRAGTVVFLPNWQKSNGAKIERALAAYCGKTIIDLEELRKHARG